MGIFGDVLTSVLNQDVNRGVSVDSRVFFVSSALNAMSAVGSLFRQGSADYATVYRPLLQSLGGNGYLQYADILNHTLGLDNAESRVVARINVGNYLRTAGRALEMDVRSSRGQTVLSNPMRPLIGQMAMAAYANDHEAFRDARMAAIRIAKEDKEEDPADFVARKFEGYHPLRSIFKTEPSEDEVMKLLREMDGDGRATVMTAVRMFNAYSEQIGAKPTTGRPSKLVNLPKLKSLSEVRSRAMAF